MTEPKKKLMTWTVAALSVMEQLRKHGFERDLHFDAEKSKWFYKLNEKDGPVFTGSAYTDEITDVLPYEQAFWKAIRAAEEAGALDVQEKTGG
jgi:hypothetical protein